jgi:transposase InsO family protein
MADLVVPMEVRMRVALLSYDRTTVTVAEFCRQHEMSRQTFYKYRRRFEAEGVAGLVPRSKRPRSSPRQVPPEQVEAVLVMHDQLRQDGWDHGARSVRDQLLAHGQPVPSDRSVHRILADHGRVKTSPKKRPRSSYRSFESSAPNGIWQLDGTKRLLADGTEVVILRLEDDHSRMAIGTRVASSENMADTWTLLEDAMTRHGRPAILLHDGAAAFSGTRRGRGQITDLEWRLRRLGIKQVVSSPYHPQTCGKKERDWQPLHQWLDARTPARTLPELQRLVDAYDAVFNTIRTHQGIGRITPEQRYRASPKAEPGPPEELPTVTHLREVTARARGIVPLGPGRYTLALGHTWAGASITVVRQDFDVVLFAGQTIIRRLPIDPSRLSQPSGLKRGRPPKRPTTVSDVLTHVSAMS